MTRPRTLVKIFMLCLVAILSTASNELNQSVFGAERWAFHVPVKGLTKLTAASMSPDGTTLYVGTNIESGPALFAVDSASGNLSWTSDKLLVSSGFMAPAVSADGATLYVSCGAIVSNGPGALFAVDSSSGHVIWNFTSPFQYSKWASQPQMSSPPRLSRDGKTVFVGNTKGKLFAVDTTSGNLRWVFNVSEGESKSIWGTPALSPNGNTLVFGTWGGHVFALDATTGKKMWDRQLGTCFITSPVMSPDGRMVYISTMDSQGRSLLYAIRSRRTSCTQKWMFNMSVDSQNGGSRPAISSNGKTVFIGSPEGKLYALDARRGKQRWAFEAGAPMTRYGSPVLAADGQTVFVGAGSVWDLHNCGLYAVNSITGEGKWNFSLGEGISHSSPALSLDGKTVFMSSSEGGLYALDATSGVSVGAAGGGASGVRVGATGGGDSRLSVGATGRGADSEQQQKRQWLSSPWNPYPVLESMRYLITDFGAVGDNRTLNTGAFERTFAHCAARGGGYVEVPPGRFLSGRMRLRSNCYLLLQPGAIVQGAWSQSHYGPDWDYWALVVGIGVYNTGVIGPSLVGAGSGGELRGAMWQMIQRYDPETNSFEEVRWRGPDPDQPCLGVCKPGLVFVQDSVNITVAGVRLRDSAGWTQTFRRIRNLLVTHSWVENSVQWGGGDGFDVESGTNITVQHSVFKNGDDCLAFRSGSFCQLRTPWPAGAVEPVRHVRIQNLTLTSSSSAIKFEASTQTARSDVGDIADVVVEDVRIRDTNRGVGLWQRTGHGALHNIVFRNLDIHTRFDSKPNFWGAGEPIFLSADLNRTSMPVLIHNISFQGVSAVSENGAFLSSVPAGLPSAIANITLANVSIVIRKTGNISWPHRDYRPASWQHNACPSASVVGLTLENVVSARTSNGGSVRFAGKRQQGWSMECVNATTSSSLRIGPGWQCFNTSGSTSTDTGSSISE